MVSAITYLASFPGLGLGMRLLPILKCVVKLVHICSDVEGGIP